MVGTEALKTAAGPYQAFRLRTTLYDEDGQPSGRPIHLWISDTPSRVPVKLQSELSVGSFILTLSEAKLGTVVGRSQSDRQSQSKSQRLRSDAD